MSTDRPDRTESAYTVDAGHAQVEMDVVAWTHDREEGFEASALSLASTNLKFGLFANTDLQFVVGLWSEDRFKVPGFPEERSSGAGDLTVRWKQNLFGNDGGRLALAVMPFLQTSLREKYEFDRMEGGLIVPLAIEGPAGWGFGVMGELDLRRDSFGIGHHAELIASATAAHDLAGSLGGYIELFSITSDEAGAPWIGTFDVGLTLGIGENIQLDTGANFGLSEETEDVTVFFGFSARR